MDANTITLISELSTLPWYCLSCNSSTVDLITQLSTVKRTQELLADDMAAMDTRVSGINTKVQALMDEMDNMVTKKVDEKLQERYNNEFPGLSTDISETAIKQLMEKHSHLR